MVKWLGESHGTTETTLKYIFPVCFPMFEPSMGSHYSISRAHNLNYPINLGAGCGCLRYIATAQKQFLHVCPHHPHLFIVHPKRHEQIVIKEYVSER